MHTYFSIKRHFVPVPKITAPQTKIYGQCTQTRYSTQLYVTFRCSRTTFFAPFFRSHFFFVGAACAAAVVVYLHCFSFRWIRYAHVQWPDIKFDGIFHRINALWDIANTHTHKKLALASSSFAAAAFFCFACASQIFQFLFASDKTYEEKIMINGSLDPLEISKRNY